MFVQTPRPHVHTDAQTSAAGTPELHLVQQPADLRTGGALRWPLLGLGGAGDPSEPRPFTLVTVETESPPRGTQPVVPALSPATPHKPIATKGQLEEHMAKPMDKPGFQGDFGGRHCWFSTPVWMLCSSCVTCMDIHGGCHQHTCADTTPVCLNPSTCLPGSDYMERCPRQGLKGLRVGRNKFTLRQGHKAGAGVGKGPLR